MKHLDGLGSSYVTLSSPLVHENEGTLFTLQPHPEDMVGYVWKPLKPAIMTLGHSRKIQGQISASNMQNEAAALPLLLSSHQTQKL